MFDKIIKILVVEDNDFDFELVERKLKTLDFHYQLQRVMVKDDYLNALNHYCPDIILSDFSLPTFSGVEALDIAQKHHSLAPFIFVSGTIGEELAVDTLLQGANDYVLKDNLNKLGPAIVRALKEADEREKRKNVEKKLEVKVDELKKLVYRISHDIRGPVCSIKGMVNLIQQTQNVSDIQDYNEMIGQITRKLEGIIFNLGSFQFIYADNVKGEDINIEELQVQLKTAVSEIEGYNEVNFNISHAGLNYYYCEFNLLYSVFFNLIHNAITFRDKNKSMRYITCSIDVSEDGLGFIIEDNGIGIQEKIKDRVMELFYRGSQLSRGAGLGLYITNNIIEILNGTIKMESKEGVGTKWEVRIPSLFLDKTNIFVSNN